ncbi:MAG: S8 family serine peptidase [Bryobacteraceae bacterium]|nr:S8 family serine peptidase [Bryobacteraceae bacterium]
MKAGVAILDSGIHPGHPHVTGFAAGRCFVPGEPPDAYLDYLGHGTAVAGAICEKTPDVSLYVAKIFHRQLSTKIEVLLAAIDWALEQPVQLVNLSLGTSNEAHREAFVSRVALAAERGIQIVSAAGSLPGTLEGVAAVELDDTVPRDRYAAPFRACGWPRPIPGLAPDRNFHGISFAVANVTGYLARELTRTPSPVSIGSR